MATSLRVARPVQAPSFARERTSRRWLNHRLPFVLPAILLAGTLLSAELASAQAGGIVSGTVTAANKMPIPEARVRLVGTNLATVTRIDGAFQVAQIPVGAQTLEVMMIGYTPKRMPVDVAAGATLEVSFILDPVPLETVRVTAASTFSPGMAGFEERRARRLGRFFTREDIDKMQARQVTDVLRRVPGMQIQVGSGAFSGGSQTAQSGRTVGTSGSRTCPMAYYVNGVAFPLSSDIPINHYVATDDVAAIEVYSGASQIPPQFNSSMFNSRCGVVVIWTRSGLGARASH